jgi:hypothetical protein
MEVINPKEYQTRKPFLAHRNIPKRAIPRMDTLYGNYGSNTIIRLTGNQEISPFLKGRHEGLEHGTDDKRGISTRESTGKRSAGSYCTETFCASVAPEKGAVVYEAVTGNNAS